MITFLFFLGPALVLAGGTCLPMSIAAASIEGKGPMRACVAMLVVGLSLTIMVMKMF